VAGDMTDFRAFLKDAAQVDLSPAFVSWQKSVLSVDIAVDDAAVSLDKKSTSNISGKKQSSVVSLVLEAKFPRHENDLVGVTSLEDLASALAWKVDDASPDSVVGVLFLALRLSGAKFPDELIHNWQAAVTDWEVTGVVDDPSVSWPALAAALGHAMLDAREPKLQDGPFPVAWQSVMGFAIEALENDWDPFDIPKQAEAKYLHRARAALEEEKARYERRLFATERFQLSLPMTGSSRRRLVDAIVTSETEFSGAMKVFARNDKKHSFLGRGFTVLILIRDDQKQTKSGNWLTISLDVRQNVHLLDLWHELESRETLKWQDREMTRVPRRKGQNPSRVLSGIAIEEQPFDQHWYIAPDHSLIASPHAQERPCPETGDVRMFPSQLSEADVLKTVFDVFDPLEQFMVHDATDGVKKRIVEVGEIAETAQKRILAAYWSKDEPLPHPSSDAELFGLVPIALRAIGAKTLGVSSAASVADYPDLEELELFPFGNGVGIVSDGGVFLLDAGRRRTAYLAAAREMTKDLALVAKKLDEIQEAVAMRAEEQAADLSRTGKVWRSLEHQKFCTSLHAELIRIRASLDQPLATKYAGLKQLSDGISGRWNIRDRCRELSSEVESLQDNGKAADELRTFHLARVAGGIGFAIVVADALAGRLAELFAGAFVESVVPELFFETVAFCGLFLLAAFGLFVSDRVFRSRVSDGQRKDKKVTGIAESEVG